MSAGEMHEAWVDPEPPEITASGGSHFISLCAYSVAVSSYEASSMADRITTAASYFFRNSTKRLCATNRSPPFEVRYHEPVPTTNRDRRHRGFASPLRSMEACAQKRKTTSGTISTMASSAFTRASPRSSWSSQRTLANLASALPATLIAAPLAPGRTIASGTDASPTGTALPSASRA